jgi:hypothetical protein
MLAWVPRRRKCLIARSYHQCCVLYFSVCVRETLASVRPIHDPAAEITQTLHRPPLSESLQLLFNRSVIYTTVRERARTLLQDSQENIDGI